MPHGGERGRELPTPTARIHDQESRRVAVHQARLSVYAYVRVCVRACVRVCVRACAAMASAQSAGTAWAAATGTCSTQSLRVQAGRDEGEFVFPPHVQTSLSSTGKRILEGGGFAQPRGLLHVPAAGLRGGGHEEEAGRVGAAVVVAVDGPAASGKGTLCRRVAQELRLAYLDTGSLYRATALRVLRREGAVATDGLVVPDEDGVVPGAAAEAMAITPEDLADEHLRSELVGQCASIVSADRTVRSALLDFQRSFCESPPAGFRGAVLDGRDIGTVIYPGAPVKLFVTADPAIRAVRRHSELVAAGKATNLDQVKNDMQQRDLRDSTRAGAPLRAAPDALTIDTSSLNSDEAVAAAMAQIRRKLPHLFE